MAGEMSLHAMASGRPKSRLLRLHDPESDSVLTCDQYSMCLAASSGYNEEMLCSNVVQKTSTGVQTYAVVRAWGPYFLLFTSPMITHMKKKAAIPSPKNACSNDAICCLLLVC